MFNVDKAHFGYYQVGNYRTFSKLEAIEIEQATGETVHWNFNDEVYSCYDWTKEPEPNTSISEFYRRRAQQLRDKYEYLVLMYSGGPDSQVILDTCLGNNIHIDEIVNVNSYSN